MILDLPCSGTGTLRRHPELKWRISEGEIGRLTRQALRLLAGGAPLVAPGGVLIAITCSLEREENEDVVSRFLTSRPDFAPVPPVLESPLAGSVLHSAEGSLDSGGWRVLTGGDHDGFTVHVLGKARV